MTRKSNTGIPPNFTLEIAGALWTIACYMKGDMPEHTWGYADKPRRVIALRWDLDDDAFVSTFGHEIYHAGCVTIEQVEGRTEEIMSDVGGTVINCLFRQFEKMPKVIQQRLLRPGGKKVIDGVTLPLSPASGKRA